MTGKQKRLLTSYITYKSIKEKESQLELSFILRYQAPGSFLGTAVDSVADHCLAII